LTRQSSKKKINEQLQKLISLAKERPEGKIWKSYIDDIRRWFRSGGDDYNLYYEIGRAFARLHSLPEAEEAFRNAIQINPAAWPALESLGEILAVQEKNVEAAEYLSLAIENNELARTDVCHLYSEVCMKTGKLDDALQLMERVFLEKERVIGLENVLLYFAKQKSFDRYKQALEVVGCRDVNALVELGEILLDEGDMEGARKNFDQALEIDDNCAPAWRGRASYCLALIEKNEAERTKILEEASNSIDYSLEIEYDDPQNWEVKSAILLNSGDYDGAIKAAQHGLDLVSAQLDTIKVPQPQDQYASDGSTGNQESERSIHEQPPNYIDDQIHSNYLEKIHRNHAALLVKKADVLVKTERYDEALVVINQARQDFPDQEIFYTYSAALLQLIGKFNEAQATLNDPNTLKFQGDERLEQAKKRIQRALKKK
jgi:tetratricopeptide (TPR) repeat protein